jgi:Zn-finger nucleic acid-binding protein
MTAPGSAQRCPGCGFGLRPNDRQRDGTVECRHCRRVWPVAEVVL